MTVSPVDIKIVNKTISVHIEEIVLEHTPRVESLYQGYLRKVQDLDNRMRDLNTQFKVQVEEERVKQCENR